MSLQALQRLCCDASIVVHMDLKADPKADPTADPDHPPRRTRTIPASVRRKVMLRDGGCQFPGCTHTRFVDLHHVVPWSRGGPPTTDNVITLCRRHHTMVHELGYRIEVTDGGEGGPRFRFIEPRGGAQVRATGEARCRGDGGGDRNADGAGKACGGKPMARGP